MKYCYLIFFFIMSTVITAQPVAICLDNIYASLPNGVCEIIPQADWIDGGSYDPRGLPVGLSISTRPLGLGVHTLMMTASNSNGSASCWTQITVEDKIAPELTCNNKTYYKVHPDQQVPINLSDLHTLSDECAVENLTYTYPVINGYGSGNSTVSFDHPAGGPYSCTSVVTIADGEPQNYCNAQRSSYYEHIRRVGIAGRQFPSGDDGGYRWHYNHSTISLYHGSTYTVNYTPGFPGNSAYRLYWRVYLDKNGDGDFTDSGELLHQWNGTGVNAFTFTSPGTFWGMSRLRFVMSYGGYASSCSGGWGEIEDVSVNLRPYFFFPWFRSAAPENLVEELAFATGETFVSSRANDPWLTSEMHDARSRPEGTIAPVPQVFVSEEVRLFPNPVRAGAPVSITGAAGAEEVVILNAAGQQVATRKLSGEANSQRIQLPELPAGAYFVRGVATDGSVGWTRRLLVR